MSFFRSIPSPISGENTNPSRPILEFDVSREVLREKPLAAYRALRYAGLVHIISRKALQAFWVQHPDSKEPLGRWFKIMRQTRFRSLTALRRTFPSADKVGEYVVFNIAGNKYRLIASLHFNRGKVYIRHVLTHQAYDRGGWMT